MTFWNRLLILIILAIFGFSISPAQTFYYKLSKIKTNDKIETNVSGGQFITFIDENACYESDKNGIGVGHGILEKSKSYSTASMSYFIGGCYWGREAAYKFKSDKSKLNVVLNNGTIYVYEKRVPPSGVITCTLIRIKDTSGGSASPSLPAASISSNAYYPTQTDVPSPPNSNSSNSVEVKRKCVWCNGTGQLTKEDNAPGNFGIEKPRQRCNVCGKWYNPNLFTHYHIQCRHCGGTGWAR